MSDEIKAVVTRDMPASDYFADPCPEPSLSSSMAKVLLNGTPQLARYIHPRLGNGAPLTPWQDETKERRHGTILHSLVLGGGQAFKVVDANDWRTKAAKTARDETLLEGGTPILKKELEKAEIQANEVIRQLRDRVVDTLKGERELTIQYQDARKIWIRTRLDHVAESDDGKIAITDLKTCHDLSDRAIWRSVESFGYHIQQAAYTESAERAWPDYAGRVVFQFAFIRLEPIVEMRLIKLDGTMKEIGEREWWRAKDIWEKCCHWNEWPSYDHRVETLHTPSYYAKQRSFC